MKKLFLLLGMLSTLTASAYDAKINGIYYDISNYSKSATVTSDGEGCYSGTVVIPNTVTYNGETYEVKSIGYEAFYACINLKTVTIPNSVIFIDDRAFNWCPGLTSVTIPNSVTSIGSYAFYDCSGLTSMSIPNSVTSIGREAFEGCNGLTSLTIGNNVASIGIWAFKGCPGELIVNCNIPSVSLSYEGAFSGSCFSSVKIGDDVEAIGNYAFSDNPRLTSITIPNSVSSIGDYAFEKCSGLTSITIPNSVTSIGNSAFQGCSNLKSVNITDLSAWCKTYFRNSESNPLYYANHLFIDGNEIIDLVIPDAVTSIGSYTFYNCDGLKSVTIHNSMTSVGEGAFDECI